MTLSEGIRPPRSEVEVFFSRNLDAVAKDLARTWVPHENRRETHEGKGRVFALDLGGMQRFYVLDAAITYTSEYTKSRWPKSRALEIEESPVGDIIGYSFHQYRLPFIKVGGNGSAANIQLANLKEVDRFGTPLSGDDSEIGGAKLSQIIGLQHKGHAFLTPFNFLGEREFIMSTRAPKLSADELRRFEEELLSPETK